MKEELKRVIEKWENEKYHGDLVLHFKDGQVPSIHENKITLLKKEDKTNVIMGNA